MANDDWFENKNNLPIIDIVKLKNQFRTDSLVCAIEEILLKKDDADEPINEGELTVLAVEAMEREVNNGGFSQFFENSSWRFTPYLPHSLSLIGANKTKALVERAIEALEIEPLTKSLDLKKYYQSIQDAIEVEEIMDKLDELDNEYYKLAENIASLLFKYVEANIDQFN